MLHADVVVSGGGAGAMAAARAGAAVLLIERYGFLGGNATAGAVAQFNNWQTAGGRRVVTGLAEEVVTRLRAYGGAGEHQTFVMSTEHRMDRVEYSPEILYLVLDDMPTEAGMRPLLYANLLGTTIQGRDVAGLGVLTKSDVLRLDTRVLIDASGDLDALKRAGARFLKLEEGEALHPATMMFRFGPINHARFDALPTEEVAALARRGYESGDLARAARHSSRDPLSGDAWFHISRLGVDATDASNSRQSRSDPSACGSALLRCQYGGLAWRPAFHDPRCCGVGSGPVVLAVKIR